MRRAIHRLTGADLKRKVPGNYTDGGGLVLQVRPTSDGDGVSRSWLFRYATPQGERYMGLGSLHTVSLTEAREAALQCRKLRFAGVDPIEHRAAERAARAVATAKAVTFDQCAAAYLAAHRNEWRSEKHARQWPITLATISPVIGKLQVSAIDTALVVKALTPVWNRAPVTASRLRGKVEAILDYAAVSGFRPPGDNPARWDGHLEHVFTATPPHKHFAAMPFAQLPDFMVKLRKIGSTVARMVEFTILCAARRGEVLGALWAEIDIVAAVWTVPAERTKANREHRVPLSPPALEIIEEQRRDRRSDFIFARIDGRRLSHDAGNALLEGFNLHGFRSTFRDWAGERTAFPREVAEAALAHRVGDAVEQAYRRGDALEKRRRLMDAWADFCAKPVPLGAVVPLKGRGHA
jgi:integrase